MVLIVANGGADSQDFSVRYKGKSFAATLGAGAVGTYIW
jgi:glucosylceramidase